MIEVWKETLLPGTMTDPKTGRQFTITDRDIRDAQRNIRRMAARKGLKVPVIWEHLDVEECDPEEWKAHYAKHTIGRLGDARRATAADVADGIATARGTLMVRHDIYDEKDAEQLKKTGGVSPKIYRGYLDSTGEEYSGLTVAHSAATPSPVQWWQAPFSVNLSDSEAICLAYPHPEINSEAPVSESCPASDWSFDGWLDALNAATGAVELSTTDAPDEGEPVAEENDDKAPKKGGEGDGKNADLKAVVDAIKAAFGATISDKVTNWNELVIALESQKGGAAEDVEVEPEPVEPPTDAAGGGPPMLMSTLDKNPSKKERAQKYAKPEREDAVARVNAALKGGRDPRTARQLLRRAGAVELSFTRDYEAGGEPWTKLLADITAYESSTPTVKLRADGAHNLSTTEVVGRPASLDATRQSEEDKVVAEQAELAKKYSPKQSAK